MRPVPGSVLPLGLVTALPAEAAHAGPADCGRVVGQSATGPDGVLQDGFVWDAANGMRRLPDHDSGNSAKPAAISNTGVIAGNYRLRPREGRGRLDIPAR